MRDEASDRKVGKNTLVVKIGGKKSKVIPLFLVTLALMVVFALINNFKFDQYLFYWLIFL
jgi:1,4-dihydroxy-2-naphthoate octaprenyltransferase